MLVIWGHHRGLLQDSCLLFNSMIFTTFSFHFLIFSSCSFASFSYIIFFSLANYFTAVLILVYLTQEPWSLGCHGKKERRAGVTQQRESIKEGLVSKISLVLDPGFPNAVYRYPSCIPKASLGPRTSQAAEPHL